MSNMNKLITVEAGRSIVSMDTMEGFSGHTKKALRDVILSNESDIFAMAICVDDSVPSMSSGGLKRYDTGMNKGKVEWSTVYFDERQAMYLLTLLGNTAKVKKFKQTLVTEFFNLKDKVLELREQELNDCLLEAKTKVVQKDKYIDVLVKERDGKQKEVNILKKAVSSKSKFKEYDGKRGALSKYIRDRGLEVDVSDLFDYLDFKGWVGITIVTERVRHMTPRGEKKYGKQDGKGVPVFSFSELDKTVKTKEFKKFMSRGNE